MKATDLRELDVDGLRARVAELEDEVFRLRIRKSMGQLEKPTIIRDARREPGAREDDSQGEGEVAMASKTEVQGVVVSDRMQKSVVVAVEAPRAARRLRQDPEAHHEAAGPQRERRRQDRRLGHDRRNQADEPPQALASHPRRSNARSKV